MDAFVRAAALTNYREVADRLGLNTVPLLRRAGFGRATLADPEQRLPLHAAVTLLEESAAQSGCITFGLQMAETRQLGDFGAISLLLTHQRSLRDALQTVIRYRHLLNESLAISIEDAGDTVIVREELMGEGITAARQSIELALAVLHRLCAALLGPGWRPHSVNFVHGAPPDSRVHARIFRCRVKFGAEFNGFICPSASLEIPNPAADPVMARYARQFLETLPARREPSIVLEVRRAIYILLPAGRATIEQIAQSLGMNVRTLQRRLDEEGVSFTELICGVRRDLVQRYLDNPHHALGRIAHMLGYTTPGSFTRWFIAQFDLPPKRWRAERRRSKK